MNTNLRNLRKLTLWRIIVEDNVQDVNNVIETGRRKEAVARVRLVIGKGHRMINGKRFKDYFKSKSMLILMDSPLNILGVGEKFNVLVKAHGGGISGQAGAVRLGIAKALVRFFPDRKAELRKHGFLTRDARAVERKKYGRPKARKRFQFSKR